MNPLLGPEALGVWQAQIQQDDVGRAAAEAHLRFADGMDMRYFGLERERFSQHLLQQAGIFGICPRPATAS